MKKLIFLFIILTKIVFVYAQVNLQTGAAEINIPLYSYSDNNELNFDIGLNYMDGNGLKVSEIASEVGTGWNLQAGGVITREQHGLPDDQKRIDSIPNPLPPRNMSFDYYDYLYYPQGYLYSAYSPSDVLSNEAGYMRMMQTNLSGQPYLDNPLQSNGNIPIKEEYMADREQDIFHLRCGNLNADFVIGKNGIVKVLNDSRIKITFHVTQTGSGRRTAINEFDITDVNGINYVFSTEEHTTPCNYFERKFYKEDNNNNDNGGWGLILDGSKPPTTTLSRFNGDPSYQADPAYPVLAENTSYITSKWYLTKITNPRTNASIVFSYESFSLDISPPGILGVTVDNTSGSINETLNVPRNIISTWRLKSITSPSSRVDFLYESSARVDVPNEVPLNEVQISDLASSSLIKKYKLSYGYFFQNSVVVYNYQFDNTNNFYPRLCLNSLQEFGSDGVTATPPYTFTYNLGGSGLGIVPPAFCLWSDHWAYYAPRNGWTNSIVPPGKNPSYGSIYSYCVNDANSDRAPVSGCAMNGIIKTITYPYGGSLTYQYEQNDAYYNGQNIVSGGVRVAYTTLFDGIDHSKDIVKQYKYLKIDELSSSGWGYEPPTYSVTKSERIYKAAGGMASASFKDFSNSFAHDFLQNAVMNGSLTLGSDLGMSFSQAMYQVFASIVIQIIIDIFTPDHKDESTTIYSSLSNESNNPLPFQYSRVEVKDMTASGDNGKTVYTFTSPDDYPINIPVYSFPFSSESRYLPWAYGLVKSIEVYNNNVKLLKQTINYYNFISSSTPDDNFKSIKWDVTKNFYDVFPPQSSLPDISSSGDVVYSRPYYPLNGHTELTTTSERTYNKSDNNYEENTTTYTYNNSNFQIKTITTTNSKNETFQKQIYYPEDYSSSGFVSSLINNNMVDIPLCTETWKTAPNNPPLMISSSATDFSTIGNGDLKPNRKYMLESSAPVSQTALQPFNPNSVVRDPNYIKQQTQSIYDNFGNLIQTLARIKPTSAMYDYISSIKPGAVVSKELMTANVINANPGEFAYTSFENDNPGGWIYNSSSIVTQACPTGSRCLQLSLHNNINISASFGITKPYILSYWALGSNITVGSTAYLLQKTVTNPSGWTYYEYTVNGNPVNQVPNPVISGDGFIDEVRFYPADARMTSYTYDVAGNKTSVCDQNNHIQYYKYDALGRMTQVIDEMGNIIKQNEFNYKQ